MVNETKIVSFFEAPVSNTSKARDLTWSELYKLLTSNPIKLKESSSEEKAKKGSYYIRGIVKDERADKNLKTCSIIIIDVDKELDGNKLPTPKQFTKALTKKGITHAVHSSATKGRCRVIMLVPPYKKKQTDVLTHAAWKMLQDIGLKFQFAGESKVKSQPWFAPQTTSIKKHQCFGLENGTMFVPTKKLLKESKNHFKKKTVVEWSRKGEKPKISGTPLERFVTELKSGTIHQAAKAYAGWNARTSNLTKKQIFDDITTHIEQYYKKADLEDKLQRWNEYERAGLEKWFDEQNFDNEEEGNPNIKDKKGFMDALKDYIPTKKYLDGLGKEKFCYPNLIIERQITTIIAEGGGGKTSLMVSVVCGHMTTKGYDVYYMDADSPPVEHKRISQIADNNGFHLLVSNTKRGQGTEGMMDLLKSAITNNISLKGKVFVFDTLKKFTDLMSKGSVKAFYEICNKLTVLGATIVLLGHANKKKDKDGKLEFEGTGDVRNDSDALIYFEVANYDGHMITVTTNVDQSRGAKVRGIFEPFSFTVNRKTREVKLLDALMKPIEYNFKGRGSVSDDILDKTINEMIRRFGPIKSNPLCELVSKQLKSNRGINGIKAYICKNSSSDKENKNTKWKYRQKGKAHWYEKESKE